MAHTTKTGPAYIDTLTVKRLRKMKRGISPSSGGIYVLKNLGVFIDTHRDQPHVGNFYEDIHRGMCRPVVVDYIIDDDMLVNQETGELLRRHDKHVFITAEFYSQFLLTYMLNNEGKDPRDGDGCLPTSHFRDARTKVYELKSFRELIRLREMNPPATL